MTLTELDARLVEWSLWAHADNPRLWYPPATPWSKLIGERESSDSLADRAPTLRVDSDGEIEAAWDPDRVWRTDCTLRVFKRHDERHYWPLYRAYFLLLTIEALLAGECLRTLRDFIAARHSLDFLAEAVTRSAVKLPESV